MKRKKSVSVTAQKEPAQSIKQEFFPSWMSFKLLVVLLLLLAGIIWFGFYATHTKEISGSDDREYTSIARNIVNGKGIVRNFVYPLDINFFEKVPPVPEFMHPPGYPLLLAGFFKVFGISDFTALLPSYLCYFILLVLLLYFAKRYLDVKTAMVAGVIFIFNKEILDASLVALSEGVYTVAFFLFFTLLVRVKSLRSVFVVGILLGVSHLIRENIYPFLIPVLVYLYFYPDLSRLKKIAYFIVGLLIPLTPIILRSLIHTGTPLFSYGRFALMAYTTKYPWLNIYRDIQNPSLFEFLMNEPGQFLMKYTSNVVSALEQFVSVSNPYILVFFILGMFQRSLSPEWQRIKVLFLFLMVVQIFFVALFTFTPRFFIPFLPIMMVFAAESFIKVSEDLVSGAKLHLRKSVFSLTVFIFLVFFITPTAYAILQPGKPEALGFKTPQYGFLVPREEAKKLNEFLNGELKGNQAVWSDLPEILEWEGNRFCGWLPTRIEQIYEINKKTPVDAILLTSLRTPAQMEQTWRYLLFSEQSLSQYRNVKVYKSGMLFAKLLIRDGRD